MDFPESHSQNVSHEGSTAFVLSSFLFRGRGFGVDLAAFLFESFGAGGTLLLSFDYFVVEALSLFGNHHLLQFPFLIFSLERGGKSELEQEEHKEKDPAKY